MGATAATTNHSKTQTRQTRQAVDNAKQLFPLGLCPTVCDEVDSLLGQAVVGKYRTRRLRSEGWKARSPDNEQRDGAKQPVTTPILWCRSKLARLFWEPTTNHSKLSCNAFQYNGFDEPHWSQSPGTRPSSHQIRTRNSPTTSTHEPPSNIYVVHA
jgi:hypothetical protein